MSQNRLQIVNKSLHLISGDMSHQGLHVQRFRKWVSHLYIPGSIRRACLPVVLMSLTTLNVILFAHKQLTKINFIWYIHSILSWITSGLELCSPAYLEQRSYLLSISSIIAFVSHKLYIFSLEYFSHFQKVIKNPHQKSLPNSRHFRGIPRNAPIVWALKRDDVWGLVTPELARAPQFASERRTQLQKSFRIGRGHTPQDTRSWCDPQHRHVQEACVPPVASPLISVVKRLPASMGGKNDAKMKAHNIQSPTPNARNCQDGDMHCCESLLASTCKRMACMQSTSWILENVNLAEIRQDW